MNLKLEELRKRLLDPTPTSTAPPAETIYKRSAELPSSSRPDVVVNGVNAGERGSTSAPETPQPTAQPDSLAGTALQGAEAGNSRYQLAQAVSKVFESTRQYQEQLADLGKSFDTIEQLARAAANAFEPIRAFRDQMEKLSSTFEPMRSFQEQLGTLAESFEPMKALHEQIAMLGEAFQINLAQLAGAMEPARNFQVQLAGLARSFEAVDELQGQFLQLSESFGVASKAGNGASGASVSD